MTIEILFPEVCGLYGDAQNAEYLMQSLPEAKFVITDFTQEPYFVSNTPDMILIGSMSEEMQRKVLEKFMPYKARINELIENGCIILATGNSAELFCEKINYLTEKIQADGLGVFPLSVKTDLFKRFNGKALGKFNDIDIVGFRSQFSFIYGDNKDFAFLKMQRGIGINKESKFEGMVKNNLICTTLLGPVLPLNPHFTQYLIKLLGSNQEIAFKQEAISAYNQRLKEFNDPKVKF